ncbi:hypothetical protein GQ457_14G018950 [Hibiscus cannabinus]
MKGLSGDAYRVSLSSSVSSSNRGSGHYDCDAFIWGEGNSGLLGHGSETSQRIPKNLNGPLEGIHASSVSCGPWHTAVVTSTGQLFTFGDGTFGVLGHGDRKSVSVPRKAEFLQGPTHCPSSLCYRLVPTCVAALDESIFCKVSCGHSMTIALTTNGHVYTMGSHVSGLLGNPQAVKELPICVEGNLTKNFVQEIACGAFHVAVITSKTEVYTWGKGASGQLGHGDTDDRNPPFLVEALKDKEDKSVACGTSFTAAMCLHKSVPVVINQNALAASFCLISKDNVTIFMIVDLYSAMLAAVRRLIRFPEALQTIMNKIKNKKALV